MTEIYNSDCVLWESAKVPAKEKGFEMADRCPLSEVCIGPHCGILDRVASDQKKLEKLREELKNIRQAAGNIDNSES